MTAKACILLVLLFTGCSYLPPFPYRIDVQQGNVVTDEMTEMLKPGMTKSQVLFVMGSPLIVDAFRENRWDYVYIFRDKGKLSEQKRLTIFFENELLTSTESHQVYPKDKAKKDLVKIERMEKDSEDPNSSSFSNIETK
ncbi:outer membrane protein assembly factor BamE [Nitrosomonas sp. PY1]|uniref:outer membrane protein assembly factor BamE n=1 Tax=Nitrosomonas sp. PY1 TaxID=1803906 RepID=UPI001FC8CA26|nr:outer membrane protein assembly factor BamE [Nitrosomonas sp. PY1]GKS69169.1 outer membrane protein assembly factor BamE [Nitrosomonas sp. PY1]